jgi:hypothetical protein
MDQSLYGATGELWAYQLLGVAQSPDTRVMGSGWQDDTGPSACWCSWQLFKLLLVRHSCCPENNSSVCGRILTVVPHDASCMQLLCPLLLIYWYRCNQ